VADAHIPSTLLPVPTTLLRLLPVRNCGTGTGTGNYRALGSPINIDSHLISSLCTFRRRRARRLPTLRIRSMRSDWEQDRWRAGLRRKDWPLAGWMRNGVIMKTAFVFFPRVQPHARKAISAWHAKRRARRKGFRQGKFEFHCFLDFSQNPFVLRVIPRMNLELHDRREWYRVKLQGVNSKALFQRFQRAKEGEIPEFGNNAVTLC